MGYINTAHTDGACAQNKDKIGGWAVVLNHGEKTISGYEFDTTNNRMELIAIRAALTLAPPSMALNIRTDSKWCIGALSEDWKITKNVDLVEEIRALIEQREKNVEFTYIPRNSEQSHARADQMAKTQVNVGRKAKAELDAANAPQGLDNE